MRSPEETKLKQFGDGGGGGSSNEAGNRRQGRSSQNNSYDNKSPLHKNSYDGTGRSKPKPNLRGADESVRNLTSLKLFALLLSVFYSFLNCFDSRRKSRWCRNSAIGTRIIRRQLMDTHTFSTKCVKREVMEQM